MMKNLTAKTVIVLSEKDAKGSLSFSGKLFEKTQLANDSELHDKELQLLKLLQTLATDGICYQVDQKELARLLETSQPTISRRMQVLRIKRWVTLLQTMAHADGKNRRNSYRVHQNALSVTEALRNDEHYLVFLHENSESGGRIRQLSLSELAQIDSELLLTHNIYLTETEVDDDTLNPLFTDELDELQENNSNSHPEISYSPMNSTNQPAIQDNSQQFTEQNQLFTHELPKNTEQHSNSQAKISYSPMNSTNQPAIHDNSQQFTGQNQLFTPELPKSDLDIYNTARAHTPPRTKVSPTGIYINTTSSCEGNENKVEASRPEQAINSGGGCGDKHLFFDSSPIIREIVFDLKAHPKFGNKASYAIINCLKSGTYETKNGEVFAWQVSEEKACEMLVVLLLKCPSHPIAFLKKLILADRNGEFFLMPQQQSLLTKIHRRINPEYQSDKTNQVQPQRNKSPIQQLFDWQLASDDLKEFKPVHLEIGRTVEALTDIAFWDASKGDKAVIKQVEWETQQFEDSLYLRFNGLMHTVYYDQICKGLELGVIQLCD